jgi:hypothetical protein
MNFTDRLYLNDLIRGGSPEDKLRWKDLGLHITNNTYRYKQIVYHSWYNCYDDGSRKFDGRDIEEEAYQEILEIVTQSTPTSFLTQALPVFEVMYGTATEVTVEQILNGGWCDYEVTSNWYLTHKEGRVTMLIGDNEISLMVFTDSDGNFIESVQADGRGESIYDVLKFGGLLNDK